MTLGVGAGTAGAESGPDAALRAAYRAEMDRLVAERLPLGWAVFLSINGIASLFEWTLFPERGAALVRGLVIYTVFAAATLTITRWQRRAAVTCVTAMHTLIAVLLCLYYVEFRANADTLLVSLMLVLTGAALLYPLGAGRMLWSSAGAALGYPLAIAAGAQAAMPALYGLFFLYSGIAVVALGALLVDRHRWTAYQHARAAQRANQAKSEFLSTVSHELRTPLTVIIGYTSLLLDDALPAVQGRDALQRVHHQSLQLLDLVQALLDLDKVEAGGVAVKVESFRLGDLIDSLRASLPSAWCKIGVTLEWVAPAPQALLRTDRAKLEMVVRNLVHNALKFTEAGRVTVSADAMGVPGRLLFTVTDTGSGIDGAELATIFDMFRQGAGGAARPGGVGLGLYIVKRFTDALGGEVGVESQPGRGTRFTVSVPLDAAAAAAAPA